VEAGSVVLGESELLLLARLAWLGLRAMERHDGGAPDGFRLVAEQVCAAAEQSRARIEREARRSKPSPGTRASRTSPVGASSASSWPSTQQAAAVYGLDPSYLRRLARHRRLDARRDGRGGWVFEPAALAAWAGRRAESTRTETAA
jgi:hypothetical protein